ncbi:MAG: HD domain-containing protein [Treponema sp.]|nr:HD domain-containing protein [Treponema sp.]
MAKSEKSILYTHKKIRDCLFIITALDVLLHGAFAFLSYINEINALFAYCLITGLFQVFPFIWLSDPKNHRVVVSFQFLEIVFLSVYLNVIVITPASVLLILSILPIFSFIWFQYNNSHLFKTKKSFLFFFITYVVSLLFIVFLNVVHFVIYSNFAVSNFEKWINLICFVFTFIAFMFECFCMAHVGRSLRTITENSLEESFGLFLSLIKAVEAKDTYTEGHSQRVAEYALKIADHLKLTHKEKETLRKAALLHDIGKIGIPDDILKKKDSLTDEERDQMRTHAQRGADILSDISNHKEYMIVAGQHHERWDGTGYPRGLKQKQIHKFARIVAVADSYDAMASNRAYNKTQKTQEEIKQEIIKGSGKQFDPEIASIMVRLIERDVKFRMRAK